ncbi:MAG TPA: MFS transporter [Gaiella sp.]|jgi:EmrB/QacA subfamily drug resistance transporter
MNPQADLTAAGRRAVLGVMCLALMMVVAAVASLNVALPDLARGTGASQSQLQWIVDAYALVFAGLLLPAGALGDRFGRKGVLLTGLVVFGGASLAAMFVNDPSTLIALRAVIGVGAALVMPTTLSIITNVFPPEERGRAVGIWAGVAGAGAIVGLLLSGTLLEWWSWPSVFAVNVTLAVLAFVAAIPLVPNSRSQTRVRLDPLGATLSSLGLFGLVFAIIEAPQRGWLDPLCVTAFGVGVVLLVAFVLYELARSEPMLDPRLFARRGFGVGSLSLMLQFFAQFGFLFVALQYLQFVLGYSPLEAGASILPMAIMLIAISPRAPRLAERLGVRIVGAIGLALMGVGFLVFTALDTDSSYWLFGTGAVITGVGLALATAPATTAIVSSLPAHRQGIASAVNDLAREVGGVFGIAVLGSVLNSGYRDDVAGATSRLPTPAAEAAQDSIAAASQVAHQAGPPGAPLLAQAEHAFVSGMSNALLVAACVLFVAAALVGALGPRGARATDESRGESARRRIVPGVGR